jgi:hypothetical protein
MVLRAKKPEQLDKRLKMFLYGPAGVGKTLAALQFPSAYLMDLERGSENYAKTITKSGSVVLQTTDPTEVKEELRTLLTEKHAYKTLIIDPMTGYYNALQEKWGRTFEKYATSEKQADLQDFGPRLWGRIKSEYKSVQRLLMSLDLNIIVTAHQKDIYGNGMTKIGVGPDSMKGDDHFYDFVFRMEERGGKRIVKTMKQRSEIGEPKFPDEFEWTYESFLKYYGREIIEKESKPLQLATPERVDRLTSLLEIVRIPDEEVSKWLSKAGVETWDEMKAEDIDKCIAHVEKKLPKSAAA